MYIKKNKNSLRELSHVQEFLKKQVVDVSQLIKMAKKKKETKQKETLQNTFGRILKMLTSKAAPFDRDKRDGRMKIFRSQGQ